VTDNSSTDVRRRAGWLPAEQGGLEDWLRGLKDRGHRSDDKPLNPAIAAFRDLIDSDPVLRMHAHRMIEEIPSGRQYEDRHLESFDELLVLMDDVMTTAPEFGETMVMLPLDGILDWSKATPAGFAFFRDPRVNDAIRNVLNTWSEFLSGPESLGVLNDSPSGWKSADAQEAIGIDQYQYDPDEEHWGFGSWNDFFTRRFRDGQRPVDAPDDDRVIVSPCEATPYRIADGVQRRDDFWAKGEPYSVEELLAHDENADAFVGGTVFQAFLSAVDYHRWHSPVSGTVVRAFVEPGTYYSAADSQGSDASESTLSQGYLAHVATRAIIVIEADEPAIGRVAVVFIGMSDVSSCVIGEGIAAGRSVRKGDELGFFQFGGSTVCVLFEPGAIESLALRANPHAPDEEPILMHVRTHLATATAR
jgi:phosphatidylserine decarboxylase